MTYKQIVLLVKNGVVRNSHINNFWTIVGYCNSIRELGSLSSLYRANIIERLNQISNDNVCRDINLDNDEKFIELSSRIQSTAIPQILERLEGGESRTHTENHDAIFTTSMFGTGVDVPHLSLMLIAGQPKTTAQYIQASGRVGRKHGAFIPVLYRPGNPRDLSHYEIFTGYHQTLNLSVEQASVSPYSTGCLNKAVSGMMVAFLRNASGMRVQWGENNGHLIDNLDDSKKDFCDFISCCKECLSKSIWSKRLEDNLKSQFEFWQTCSSNYKDPLPYSEQTEYRGAEKCVVLGNPAHPPKYETDSEHWSVFKNVPTSLRDVEETTGFQVVN